MAMKQVQFETQKLPEEEVELAEVSAVPDPVKTAEAQLPTEWWLSPLSYSSLRTASPIYKDTEI